MVLSSILLLVISCNNKNQDLIKIVNYSNKNLNSFLSDVIHEQIQYIEMKTSDYPHLIKSGNDVLNLNNKIEDFLNCNYENFNELKFINYRDSLNNNYKLNLKFENIKQCNDSIKIIILKSDLLIVNYSINKDYIAKHCNIIE